MAEANVVHLLPDSRPKLPIGVFAGGSAEVAIDLNKLLAGRCLIQGSSGAGKSVLLRRLIEEAFDYLPVMIVDPEGEFGNLAGHIGATTLLANDLSAEGLTAAAIRARHHRIPLHLDLSDLEADQRIVKASAFFAGLMSSPREDWANTVLVAIDEAHLLAPHIAGSVRDAEIRRLGVATLTDLCARGRKRGIAPVVATQRLAKLATSVVSELHNVLIGLNVFDRDVARAADLLGFTGDDAARLRRLEPGQFFAFGPALCSRPVLAQIGETITAHLGATPDILGPADVDLDAAAGMLDLDALREAIPAARHALVGARGGRALEAFLLDPDAAAAVRVIDALRRIAPNATTGDELARHLAIEPDGVDAALDLLASLGAVDTVPKGEARIVRLSAKLRLRAAETPVVSLS